MWIKVYIVFLFSLINRARAGEKVNERWYPCYHLAPPYGWMNDPNGFSFFEGEIHLFYQFNPNSSQEPGTAHWGHAKSKDFFNWKHLPIAMYPDQPYDKDGVFSGSALIENGEMKLFYTGQVKYSDDDYTNRQALSFSTDGVNFTKYELNPIIPGDEYQPNFRDPKVWKHNEKYYMVLGNSFDNDTKGRALLFTAEDKTSWNFKSVLDQSDGSLGYMWECPDFFQLGNTWVLLFSPQGIKPQGDKYRNLYQTGYKTGSFDYVNYKFSPTSDFYELDKGTDFYATQTYYDEIKGRRIVVAWLDMWKQDYPERNDGFTGQMTLPRKLSLTTDKKLIQWPVEEISVARGSVLRSGSATDEDYLTLENNAAEIKVEADLQDLVLYLASSNETSTMIISYSHENGTVTVDRGGEDGIRRTSWNPGKSIKWLIYLDRSSVELFCGQGEVTFSDRFFPDGPVTIGLGKGCTAKELTITSMMCTVPSPA